MTLVDASTGEVVTTALPAVRPPGPMTMVDVAAQCRSLEVWAEQCDDIDALREADNRLAAIGEYVKRTSIEGRAKVEAARRRLEARIGVLLGPTKVGERHDLEPSLASEGGAAALTPNERSQFRKLADHPEIVDKVIDTSTDESPASRRRVLDEINKQVNCPPPETPEQRQERELAEGDQREADRLAAALRGWDSLSRFNTHVRRGQVLALLTDVQRRQLAEVEECIHG